MSEKIELELKMRTGAAVSASREAASAVTAITTAADAAGKSQNKLGKEVALTRTKQLEATEAIRRAKDAQQDLTLTVTAFGPKSKEAAAAATRLAVATLEAKKAGILAADALEKTSRATTAAANAEDTKLTPATRRAAAAVAKMSQDAERAASDLNRMDLQAIAASKGTDRLAKGLTAMQVAGGNLLAQGITKTVSGIGDALTGSVTSAIEFEKSFTGITKVLDDKSSANIERVDEGVKDLATTLGVLPTEIAAMTASLAASGLQDDLFGYTEDAAKLGVAFDLTGQEAGHALASLTASLGLSRDEMQSLMGTINELDDGMNSSSKQLVEYLEGVAGIGRSASISGETMLALGSAIISTGSAPDKAATGVKNFIATMEAGSAATDAQVAAFAKLGFSAEAVAKQMATGHAEEQIKKVATALAGLKPEEKFGVMIDLFGRESIGSIGGLATGVELLGQSFAIAGDKVAAAGSVQAEFDRVSQTSGHKIDKLKAQIQVLGIEMGDRLMPHITQVVDFLSSPEGQEWGAAAVEKTVKVVTTLADVVGTVVGGFADFTEAIGGASVAAAGLGAAAVALTGPLGAAAAAGAAIGYGMAEAYSWAATRILGDTGKISAKMLDLLNRAADIRHEEHVKEMAGIKAEMDADTAAQDQHYKNREKAEALAQRYEAAELARIGKRATAEEKLSIQRKASQLASAVEGNSRLLGGGTEEDRLANFEKYVEGKEPAQPKEKTAKEKKAAAKAGAKARKVHDKEEKNAAKFAEDVYDFDQDVAQYYAKFSQDLREEDLKSQEAAAAHSHDVQVTALDREKELLDAGRLSHEDAASAHESILMRKLAADEKYARRQIALAKTDAQRQQAQTRLEAVEHGRRVAIMQRAQRAEQKAYEKRLAIVNEVTTGVTSLTGAMTTAVLEGAAAQKGALWMVLGEELKVIAKSYAIKSAASFASAAIAAAGIVTAPLAAGHVAAGVMAAGVAVAAGGASIAATAIGEARGGGKTKEVAEKTDTGGGIDRPATGTGTGGGKGEAGDAFEKSEVPVSFDERNPAQSSTSGARQFNITVNVGNLMGKDSKALGRELAKAVREAEAGAGKAY